MKVKATLAKLKSPRRVIDQPASAYPRKVEESPADSYNTACCKMNALFELIEAADMQHLGTSFGEPAMPWVVDIARRILDEMNEAFTRLRDENAQLHRSAPTSS